MTKLADTRGKHACASVNCVWPTPPLYLSPELSHVDQKPRWSVECRCGRVTNGHEHLPLAIDDHAQHVKRGRR